MKNVLRGQRVAGRLYLMDELADLGRFAWGAVKAFIIVAMAYLLIAGAIIVLTPR
jgi:hypothetical protein